MYREHFVTESSSTNIFKVNNKVIYTHPANNLILNGITRMEVIRLAKLINFEVKEEQFTVGELLKADEVFMTSTTAEVTPIIQIDNTVIGTAIPGPVTIKLLQAHEEQIAQNKLMEYKRTFV